MEQQLLQNRLRVELPMIQDRVLLDKIAEVGQIDIE